MSKRKKRRSTAPAATAAARIEIEASPPAAAAAAPAEELGFSESTAHWLAQGDQTGPIALVDESAAGRFAGGDTGKRRDLAILGGAALLALGLVWILHGHGSQPGHGSVPAPPAAAARPSPAAH
jgi:hypothetical protein